MQVSISLGKITTAVLVCSALALSACSSSSSSRAKTEDKPSITTTGSIKPAASARAVGSLEQRPSEINRDLGPVKITRTGEVYLLRGLANVFSRGMDTMGEKLVKKGVDARVYNHASWKSLADNIVARSKRKKVSYPVVILGHSLGANAAMQMARYLGEKDVKVAYVTAFDPTVPTALGKNVEEAINYYIPKEDKQKPTVRLPGFKGKLKNIDVSKMAGVTHMNVEKNPKFQRKAIDRIMAITKAKSSKKSKKRVSKKRTRARLKKRS